MTNIAVTQLINNYKVFSRDFWLSYKALEAVMVPSEFDKIKMTLMKSKWIDPKIFERIDKNEYEIKRAEIDNEWKKKSEDARNTGIAIHDKIHNMLVTDLPECKRCFGIPTDKYKVEVTEKFLTEDGIFPEYRMEIPLDEDYQLVGVADLIIKEGNRITIIDFKTDEKIEDCALIHYQLQLSLYAWLVKHLNPDFDIQSLEIMHIKDGKLKKTYPVEYLEKDVETLIKWHLKATKLKKETDKCKEIKY